MSERPNVLFLMDDEHRHDVAGFAGDEVVRTPTLDWLAETGTVFTNAYTPAPACVPARHSIRTGQLPRTWDRFGLEAFESPDHLTLPKQLGRYGYMTAQSGKEHYPGFAQMQGWRKRLGPTPMKRTITDGVEEMVEPHEFERYGTWDDWKWSAAKEIKRAGVGNSRVQVQDRRSVEQTEQFVKQYFSAPYYDRAQPGRPLFLKTSLIQPHFPFFAEHEERFTYYLNRVDPYVEQPEAFHPVMSHGRTVSRGVTPGEDASEREIRRATAAYYAMVETVDEHYGTVIEALEHNGEDPDEWVIIFTSDHGEFLGERGMWGKGQFYESSARVPLVIRYPDRFDPGVVEQNVNLCDLYATLCDLADAPVPEDRDSRSLVPLLEGDTTGWDNETISQAVGNDSVSDGVDSEDLMIKRDDLKYCYFGEEYEEVLFDLDRDHGETTNVLEDADYADAVAQFRDRRSELGYGPNADPDYETAGYQ